MNLPKEYLTQSRQDAKTRESSSFAPLREPLISLSVVEGSNAGAKRMEALHEPLGSEFRLQAARSAEFKRVRSVECLAG